MLMYRTACLTICMRHLEVSNLLSDDYPEISLFHSIHAFEMIAHAGLGKNPNTRDHERVFDMYRQEIQDDDLRTQYYKMLPAIGSLIGKHRKTHEVRNATLYVDVVRNQEPSKRFKSNDARLVFQKVEDIVNKIQATF